MVNDLTFRVSDRDFLITAHTQGGRLWLFHHAGIICVDDGKGSIAVETEAEFERLRSKAVASGLRVARQ
jgi:hypothetical protein